jgi:dipeptidyl-peptidase 4
VRWALASCLAAACGGGAGAAAPAAGNLPVVEPRPSHGAADATGWPALDDSFIERQTATLNFQLGKPGSVWVAPDGASVLFTRSGARSFASDLYAFDLASGKVDRVLGAAELLAGGSETLSVEEKARRERMRQVTRGISGFSPSEDGARLLVPLSGRLFVFDRARKAAREIRLRGPALAPSLSPDGKLVALVRDGDLYTVDVARGQEKRLTRRRSDAVEHGLAEFVAQEEMGRMKGMWWSPDSRFIAFQKTDATPVEVLHVADATNPEQPPLSFRYPRAGTDNAVVDLGIAPARGGRTVWVKWDHKRFPYLTTVTWAPRAPLTIAVMNRRQTELVLYQVDPRTGATRQLLREEDAAWINLDQEMPAWLPDGSGFLWTSERDGAWQLELRDRKGGLVRTLTRPDLGYLGFAGFDRDRNAAWVLASTDPLQSHVHRVPLDGSALERVTREEGEHAVAPGEKTPVHVMMSVRGGETRWSVRRADGSEAGQLPSAAEKPPFEPGVEHTTATIDGSRVYHAAVVRPRAFDRRRRYSVLLNVYGGPHANMVDGDPNAYLLDQWYADAGFIVVRIDGRGTPKRGRAWERVIKNDLVTVAMADQVSVLRELARTRPEMDLEQVGVYGWSFGGYMAAMAVLLEPDLFRAAVAGAPVTDWRDYDTFYTERYMGLPADNPEGYKSTSALTHAASLRRPLLLVHGTTDDNVYFTHTLKLTQALFRAGREFEMLPLAGFTHMVPDPAVKSALVRRIVGFFRRHLEPPH